jgi:hypothetical protein|mmetsp:Transcript_84040/g.140256  ORF Transcript_84040/g.140256 Transcript_84040/m.140256 type:complete len:218 (+) Transcript_84040:403-1056(+)
MPPDVGIVPHWIGVTSDGEGNVWGVLGVGRSAGAGELLRLLATNFVLFQTVAKACAVPSVSSADPQWAYFLLLTSYCYLLGGTGQEDSTRAHLLHLQRHLRTRVSEIGVGAERALPIPSRVLSFRPWGGRHPPLILRIRPVTCCFRIAHKPLRPCANSTLVATLENMEFRGTIAWLPFDHIELWFVRITIWKWARVVQALTAALLSPPQCTVWRCFF